MYVGFSTGRKFAEGAGTAGAEAANTADSREQR